MIFNLTPLEIIATLFALLILVKMVVISIKREVWFDFMVRPMLKGKGVKVLFILLAGLLFYYLIQTITIVQIFAVIIFSSILLILSFLAYQDDLFAFTKKIYGKKFNAWMWLQIVIWTILSIWVLLAVFG